jgi:hypothetical protein
MADSYGKKQIDLVLNDKDEFFRMKVQSGDNETNWLNISPAQLKRIRGML